MDNKKFALVTGSTGTIGSAICELLAKEGINLILAGRNKEKLEKLKNYLESKYKNEYKIFLADLRTKNSILKEIERLFYKENIKINILINNASETPRKKIIIEEGLECQFAVNILGYHRMIYYLKDFMTTESRIVNVASYWAGDLDLNDLQFEKRSYNNNIAYRQSKQAERMLSFMWSEKLKNQNIMVNSCHPGDANSKLSNDLGFGGHETPFEAAETPVYLAISSGVKNITGKYFEHKRMIEDPFIKDKQKVEQLFEICNQYL